MNLWALDKRYCYYLLVSKETTEFEAELLVSKAGVGYDHQPFLKIGFTDL